MRIAEKIIKYRFYVLVSAAIITAVLFWYALGTTITSGYFRLIPGDHPISKTYFKHLKMFGGGDKIYIAVTSKSGSVYDADFLKILSDITEDAYYLKGIDRNTVSSLYTPTTVYVDIVDGGFEGNFVAPRKIDYSPEAIEKIRKNVEKAGIVGSLISDDYTSAMLVLGKLNINNETGKPYESVTIYNEIQEKIKKKYESDKISIQVIGFDIAMGEIATETKGVLVFLIVAVVIIAFLSKWFLRSWKLALLGVFCSIIGVIWNLGIVNLLGYQLDLLSILTPFLIFAIGMSHSIQILNRVNIEWELGHEPIKAAVVALEMMMAPAIVALATDLIGAVSVYFIPIQSIQEMRIFTSIGVVCLMFTNVFLQHVSASYLTPTVEHVDSFREHREWRRQLWITLSAFATRKFAIVMCSVSALLLLVSGYFALGIQIGDLQEGVPELKESSQYNRDSRFISEHYSVGEDNLIVFVEAPTYSCIDYNTVKYIDDLAWVLANNPHVQGVQSMPQILKIYYSFWMEGYPKWMTLSPNSGILQNVARAAISNREITNGDCSVMPITAYLKDHKATSINSVVKTVNDYVEQNKPEGFQVKLAGGNAGVMAAVNDTVQRAELPLIASLYGAVTILCLMLFKSWRATVCILIPLSCVTIFGYAVMSILEIGLKTSTLPVVALGTGLGIDYGIYIFSILLPALKEGKSLKEAYLFTLETTGSAVCFIGITLSIAVGTWMFSALKFQADMGILFSSMLILNMFGALLVLPGIAYFLFPNSRPEKKEKI